MKIENSEWHLIFESDDQRLTPKGGIWLAMRNQSVHAVEKWKPSTNDYVCKMCCFHPRITSWHAFPSFYSSQKWSIHAFRINQLLFLKQYRIYSLLRLQSNLYSTRFQIKDGPGRRRAAMALGCNVHNGAAWPVGWGGWAIKAIMDFLFWDLEIQFHFTVTNQRH